MEQALEHGHVIVDLHGHKLHGGYLLQRTRKVGDQQQWLLIKQRDRYASETIDVTEKYLKSVATGRTMQAIAGELQLMDPRVRASRERAGQLLDPVFLEVGRSGRRWTPCARK